MAAGPGAGGRRSPCAGAPARTGGRGRRRHPRCDPAAARSRPCRLQRLRCAPGLPAGPRPGQRPGAATDAGAGPPAEPAQEPVRRLPRAGAGQPVRRIAVAAVPGRRAAAQPPLARPAALAAGSRAAPGAVRPAWPDRHLGTALAAVVRFHRRAQRAGRSRDPAAGAGGLPAGTEPGVRRVDGTAAARRRGAAIGVPHRSRPPACRRCRAGARLRRPAFEPQSCRGCRRQRGDRRYPAWPAEHRELRAAPLSAGRRHPARRAQLGAARFLAARLHRRAAVAFRPVPVARAGLVRRVARPAPGDGPRRLPALRQRPVPVAATTRLGAGRPRTALAAPEPGFLCRPGGGGRVAPAGAATRPLGATRRTLAGAAVPCPVGRRWPAWRPPSRTWRPGSCAAGCRPWAPTSP